MIADMLHTVGSGSVPSSAGMLGPIFERVLGAPDRSAEDFQRLARAWEKLGVAGGDAPIVADSVLFGLVQLSCARLREQDPLGTQQRLKADGDGPIELVLKTGIEGQYTSLTLKTDDWSDAARTEIHRWFVDKVRPLFFDENDADMDDEEGVITLDIERRHGSANTPFGVIEIAIPTRRAELVELSRKQALVSFRREGRPSLGRLLGELFDPSEADVSAEDPRNDTLRAAWTAYVKASGNDAGSGAIACIAPLPDEAKTWMSAWATAVSGIGAQTEVDDELRRIEEEIERDDVDVRKLIQRRKELIKLQQERPPVDVHTIRSVLRLCTGRTEWEGSVRQLVLIPDHPLVLRLRLVADRILATTLRQLWTVGWDRRTLDDLDGALDEWGLPEPIHCYGFWDGAPLVFDGWLEGAFALFSPLGAGREIDAQGLGVRHVARELERYASLFPAAADGYGSDFMATQQGNGRGAFYRKNLIPQILLPMLNF